MSIGFSILFFFCFFWLHNFTFTHETKRAPSSISIQKRRLPCWCFTFQRETTAGVVLSQRGSHHPGYWPRQRSHTLHHFWDSLPLLSAEGTVFPAGFSLGASSVDAHPPSGLAFPGLPQPRSGVPGQPGVRRDDKGTKVQFGMATNVWSASFISLVRVDAVGNAAFSRLKILLLFVHTSSKWEEIVKSSGAPLLAHRVRSADWWTE